MAHSTQLVGIIELDADPNLDAPYDENLDQTLRRLRRGAPTRDADPESDTAQWMLDEKAPDSVVVLKADLGQLACDLQCELARLLDRLLVLSHQ